MYEVIDKQIRDTYAKDSKATLKTQLYDPYVKFFRWAVDRLQGHDGIVCYVSNNSFVDQIAFDGMRKHLLQDFTRIYHIDLHGNVRQNPKLSGTIHNVFGIQVGVGITVAVRSAQHMERKLYYHRVPEDWRKEEKLAWLGEVRTSGRLTPPPSPLPASDEGESEAERARRGWATEGALWEKLRPLVRQMRTEPTEAEKHLWQNLRKRQQDGVKFRRQHAFDRFIVDFYCPAANLVIEVDGPIHDYTVTEDQVRQAYLESLGLHIIRFTNDQVLNDTQQVLAQINQTLSDSPSSLAGRGLGGGVNSGTHSMPANIPWQSLAPDSRHTWRVPKNADEYARFLATGSKEGKALNAAQAEVIFKAYSGGVKTNRDDAVYDFNEDALAARMERFVEDYNLEVDRYKRAKGPVDVDTFVNYTQLKWDGTLKGHLKKYKYGTYSVENIRHSLYRPFVKRNLYFDGMFINSVYLQHYFFPNPETEQENCVINFTTLGSEKPFMVLISDTITDLHLVGAGAATQCFPFYTYDPTPSPSSQAMRGVTRRENITDWSLAQFRTHYADESISKWDIFYYVYGVLHHPGYRAKFADNLKRDLPRIPLTPPPNPLPASDEGESERGFWAFSEAGRKLADLHLNYEQVTPYKLRWIEAKDTPLSYKVVKMRLSKDKSQLVVNESLTLADIPSEVFQYKLGNRSALDWVIDQYQVTTDKRSGITSDPNRNDDPRYIVDLVGRVVAVSIETVKIVDGLPEQYSESP